MADETKDFEKRFQVVMDYVVVALLVLVAEVGFACWVLWQILSELRD